jgi:hypothetical protein
MIRIAYFLAHFFESTAIWKACVVQFGRVVWSAGFII